MSAGKNPITFGDGYLSLDPLDEDFSFYDLEERLPFSPFGSQDIGGLGGLGDVLPQRDIFSMSSPSNVPPESSSAELSMQPSSVPPVSTSASLLVPPLVSTSASSTNLSASSHVVAEVSEEDAVKGKRNRSAEDEDDSTKYQKTRRSNIERRRRDIENETIEELRELLNLKKATKKDVLIAARDEILESRRSRQVQEDFVGDYERLAEVQQKLVEEREALRIKEERLRQLEDGLITRELQQQQVDFYEMNQILLRCNQELLEQNVTLQHEVSVLRNNSVLLPAAPATLLTGPIFSSHVMPQMQVNAPQLVFVGQQGPVQLPPQLPQTNIGFPSVQPFGLNGSDIGRTQ